MKNTEKSSRGIFGLNLSKKSENVSGEAERLKNFYGCDEKGDVAIGFTAFHMDEISWEITASKKYTLIEISGYKEKVSISGLMSCWRGTGKSEWEFYLSYMLIFGLRKAWEEGIETLDVTMLFNRDLIATGNMRMSAEEVKNHIIRQFTIVSETDEEVILTLNVD